MKKLSFGFCFVAIMVLSRQSSATLLSLNEAVSFNLITRGNATVHYYDVGMLDAIDKTALQVVGSLNARGDQIIKDYAIVGETYTNFSVASWRCSISASGGINIADTMDHLEVLSLMLASTPSNSLSDSLFSFTTAKLNSDFHLSNISTEQFNNAKHFVASSADIFYLGDYLIINVSGEDIVSVFQAMPVP